MNKLCVFLALAVSLPAAGLGAAFSKPLFLYEADPFVSFSPAIGYASDYSRALNREIRTGKHQGAALAFGYRYTSWSFELEVAYRTSEVNGHLYRGTDPHIGNLLSISEDARGTIKDTSLMFNAHYVFPTRHIWRPYAGGGIGFSRVALRDFQRTEAFTNSEARSSDSDIAPAFQLMVGMLFELAPETDLMIGYRYFGTGTINWDVHDYWDSSVDEDLKFSGTNVHLLEFGLRLNF